MDLGLLPPFSSVLTTLQKSIDPVIAMVYIGDYRKALRRILCKNLLELPKKGPYSGKSRRVEDSTGSRSDPLHSNKDPIASLTRQNAI